MKYGESTFDILYLLFAVAGGCLMLIKGKNKAGKMMGAAALILGLGDAFHLVPRVLNYFIDADFTAALGIGKLVTSITMTIFYVLMYYIWLEIYDENADRKQYILIWVMAAMRIILCCFPQNGWLRNDSSMTWAIIRNIPFVVLGAYIMILYFRKREENRLFRPVWLLICLSFLFYIPVAVGAGVLPILGMLMLPKTVCYILMIVIFLKSVREERNPAAGE